MDPISISFCIKTNRKKEWKLVAVIASILSLGIDPEKMEILVTGDTDFTVIEGEMARRIRRIPDLPSAANGRLATMMNTLAREARHPWVCMFDDDVIFCEGWYEKVCLYLADHPDVDLCAFPIRNTDGSRFWDWAIHTEGRSILIDPRATDPRLYVTGTLGMLKREIWQTHKWDDSRGFYEFEDTDWSQRVIAAGHKPGFCTGAFVLHNDWRYFQVGPGIHRAKDFRESAAVSERPMANAIFRQFLDEMGKALEGVGGFAGDLRWKAVPALPVEDKAKLAELVAALGALEDRLREIGAAAKNLSDYAL